MVVVELGAWGCFLLAGSAFGRAVLRLVFVQRVPFSAPESLLFVALFGFIGAVYGLTLVEVTLPNVLDPQTTLAVFACTMHLQLLLVGFIGPWVAFHGVMRDLWWRSRQPSGRTARWVGHLRLAVEVVVVVALQLLIWFALPAVHPTASGSTYLQRAAAKVSFLGVAGMGALGGYAAFATPHAFLFPFLARNGGDQARSLVKELQRRQRHLVNLWIQKRRVVAQLTLQQQASPTGEAAGARRRSFASWLLGSHGGSGPSAALLEQECEGMRRVSMSIFLQTNEALGLAQSADRGRSWSSRASAVFGAVLSVYAIVKIALIAVHFCLVFFGVGGGSAGSERMNMPRPLLVVLWLGDVAEGEGRTSLTRAAVLFNAAMIANSLRGLLLTVFRVMTLCAASVGPGTMVSIFSACAGAYFTAQQLMLRLQLPADSRLSLALTLGDVGHVYYQRINDGSFLLACLCSYLLFHFVLRLQRNVVD